MNKKAFLIVLILLIFLGFVSYKFILSRVSGISGFRIVSQPEASIFLNDKLVGKTPLEEKYQPGEYVLKLIPQESATQTTSWQGKINLYPSVLTYVNWDLGISELTSGGEILTLEKIRGDETQLAIFSQPDGATVLLDGEEKGVTPLFLKDIIVADHDVTVTSPGFISRKRRVKTTFGYKLVLRFQLACVSCLETAPSDISPTPSAALEKMVEKQTVVIKSTETGFLRVREGPGRSYKEVGQVKPGEKFLLLEEKEGWYKISYLEGKEGWVSARYVEKEK